MQAPARPSQVSSRSAHSLPRGRAVRRLASAGGAFGALILAFCATGCASSAAPFGPAAPGVAKATDDGRATTAVASDGPRRDGEPRPASSSSSWIGAAAEGDILSANTTDTFLGVWVDVPEARPEARPPLDLALVVDTSGSMAGAKIENARAAASTLVRSLRDGDIVALDAFSDQARTVVSPTRIDELSRAEVLRQIAQLAPLGGTNMFAGLTLAEAHVAQAPSSHTLRRVVLISDGIANVGPSSPEVLGQIAERGLVHRAQVTSIGVGNDYDERTLNALSVRSSGRLHHISEPRDMARIMAGELKLLDATLASESFVEVIPAPGVVVSGAEGIAVERTSGGGLRIPLGALHAGQHREALVRVRIVDPGAFEGHSRALASVRLRFRDAAEGDVERIQEVIARTQLGGDDAAIARSVQSRTKAIVAIMEASKTQLQAAQRINDGNFVDADKELERAELALAAQARTVTSSSERKRLEVAASNMGAARAATKAMPMKPKAEQRAGALRMNADAMHDAGF